MIADATGDRASEHDDSAIEGNSMTDPNLQTEALTGVDEGAATPVPEGSDRETLLARIEELQHAALKDRDLIVGLRAQVETLSTRLHEIESTDVAVAFSRVDALEDEREALIDQLHRLIVSSRELDKLLREDVAKQVVNVKSSTTWRVGSAVMRPVSIVARRIRR